jgi:hypothetical protein
VEPQQNLWSWWSRWYQPLQRAAAALFLLEPYAGGDGNPGDGSVMVSALFLDRCVWRACTLSKQVN